jgi:hypothetical protein
MQHVAALQVLNLGSSDCRITAITAVITESGAIMPKLKNRPPQYKHMGKYAVIYVNGKRIYLGLHGSSESHAAYARFVAERRINGDHVHKGVPR